ncbi:methyltransferase [Streptomyces sp. NPDC015125]|uniref:methyltransferase n=1 Tax=Streptomyces sp. NPDC015125 TaxID=3364938 RepID=UPI0036FC27EE
MGNSNHLDDATIGPHYKAHYQFQYLTAAFQFGLFDILEKTPGITLEELSVRIGLARRPTRILLLGCTTMGLVWKEGDGYHNAPYIQPVGDLSDQPSATYLHCIYRAAGWFCESLKEDTNVGLQREIPGTAPTLYGRLAEHPELESTFHTMMGAASHPVPEGIAAKVDLSEYKYLLDIGGGAALNAVHLARSWPGLEITIGDLSSVAPRANEKIAELGLADRVRAVRLDAFHDEFPIGHDSVLFAHFLEIWSADRIRGLLTKASHALPSGGGVFVMTHYQDDDETGPERAAYLSAYVHTVASGEGMVYTAKEYEQWFSEAGIDPVKRVMFGPDTVVICGRKR